MVKPQFSVWPKELPSERANNNINRDTTISIIKFFAS